jgi:hypothetical protein
VEKGRAGAGQSERFIIIIIIIWFQKTLKMNWDKPHHENWTSDRDRENFGVFFNVINYS